MAAYESVHARTSQVGKPNLLPESRAGHTHNSIEFCFAAGQVERELRGGVDLENVFA